MYRERNCQTCGFAFLASYPSRRYCYPGKCLRSKISLTYAHSYPLEGLDLVRERVRQRDLYTCQNFFKVWLPGTRRFDVHHLDEAMESVKNYRYDNNNLDKMITYCHKCHLNLD